MQQTKWYSPDTKDQSLAASINAVSNQLKLSMHWSLFDNSRLAQLYNNIPHLLNTPTHPARIGLIYSAVGQRERGLAGLSLNVIQSCTDTLVSKVGKNKPRVRFVTDDGTDQLQEKARNLTHYVDGVFYAERVHEKMKQFLKHCCIYGMEVIKVFSANGEIKVEPVSINEIYVDLQDGLYSSPREMFQKRWVPKQTLMQAFPDKMIQISGETTDRVLPVADADTELVEVTEAWHLPDPATGKEGRHVMTTMRVVLVDEEWKRNSFPFAFLRWSPALGGFYCQGLAHQLAPLQATINRMLRSIVYSLDRFAVPKIFVEETTEISPGGFNDALGGIVRYANGPRPEVASPPGVMPREIYEFVMQLYDKAFQISGISQLNASAQKPAGIYSAAGMRDFADIADMRFAAFEQAWEQFGVDIAEQIIEESRELHTGNKKVKAFTAGHWREIPWSQVNMKRDEFVIQAFSVSGLPRTPAARLDEIQEMADKGALSPEQIADLREMPDASNALRSMSAPYRAVQKQISQIVNEKLTVKPTKYMNVQLAAKIALETYNDILTNDDPNQDVLLLLEDYLDTCNELITQAAQEAAASQPSGPSTGAPPPPAQ